MATPEEILADFPVQGTTSEVNDWINADGDNRLPALLDLPPGALRTSIWGRLTQDASEEVVAQRIKRCMDTD